MDTPFPAYLISIIFQSAATEGGVGAMSRRWRKNKVGKKSLDTSSGWGDTGRRSEAGDVHIFRDAIVL